jgi:hypothetical protein
MIRQAGRDSRFWTEEVIAMPMTIIQEAEARGEARGRREGELGALRGALAEVVADRFGSVPSWVEAAVEGADAEALRAWVRRAATVARLEDIGLPRPAS